MKVINNQLMSYYEDMISISQEFVRCWESREPAIRDKLADFTTSVSLINNLVQQLAQAACPVSEAIRN